MAKKFKLNRESRDQIESIHNNLLEMQNEILLDPSNVSLNDIRIRLIGYRDDLDKIMLNFDERKKLGITTLVEIEKVTLCHIMIDNLWYLKISEEHRVQTMS